MNIMKTMKKIALTVWAWYDCEPTPEAIARREAQQAKEQEELERMRKSAVASRGNEDLLALIGCGVICVAVLLGCAYIFDGCSAPNIDIKSHVPVKITVEYR